MRHSLLPSRRCGFTLIELLVVLAIVALLASIATPRYLRSLEVARERALRVSLTTMRDAIDQYAADKGRWPGTLQELADARYLREVPEDPLTGRRDSWLALTAQGPPGEPAAGSGLPAGGAGTRAGTGAATWGGIGDVRSGAGGRSQDGSLYADW